MSRYPGPSCNRNPWFRIFFEPKRVIRCIVDYNPRFRFWALAAIVGFMTALRNSQQIALGVSSKAGMILLVSLILAVPIGAIILSVNALLIYWVGKLFGGKASYLEVRAAYSWSNAPLLFVIISWLILVAIHGQAMFIPPQSANSWVQVGAPAVHHFSNAAQYGIVTITSLLILFNTILYIWSFVILLNNLAEVQGFSLWRSFFNIVIWWLVYVVLAVILMSIFVAVPSQAASMLNINQLFYKT